jgi:hypothetical protein
MSRITKTIAEQVAKKLTEKKSNEIKELRLQLKQKATEIKLANTPVVIMDLFKEYPDFFNEKSGEYINGPGLNRYSSFSYTEEMPGINEGLQITAEEAEQIIEIDDKIKDLTAAINKVRTDIEVALLSLRTYNNIEKEFPEAFAHLPERTSMALAINLADVRKQIA